MADATLTPLEKCLFLKFSQMCGGNYYSNNKQRKVLCSVVKHLGSYEALTK